MNDKIISKYQFSKVLSIYASINNLTIQSISTNKNYRFYKRESASKAFWYSTSCLSFSISVRIRSRRIFINLKFSLMYAAGSLHEKTQKQD